MGISRNDVTPPAAQARLPVRRSSLWVRPGSRKWTWSSITPGMRWRPEASTTFIRAGMRCRVHRRDPFPVEQYGGLCGLSRKNDRGAPDQRAVRHSR